MEGYGIMYPNLPDNVVIRFNYENVNGQTVTDTYTDIPCEISINGITKRVIESGVASGNGSVFQFSGFEPLDFEIKFMYVYNSTSEERIQHNRILNVFKSELPVDIISPKLEKWGVKKCVILNITNIEETENYSTVTFSCKEYVSNFFIEIDNTDEEEIRDSFANSGVSLAELNQNAIADIVGG